MNVQCSPTDWHNQIDIVMVIGGARPVPQVDVALGVGSGCVTLPRGDRSSVPRGGPRPATRSIRRPVGTLTQHVADGIIHSIARISAVRT